MNTLALQSLCILGRQPALGLAELESLYGADVLSIVSPQVAGLSMPVSDVDFKRLGGSTRLCKVLAELPGTDWKKVESYLAKTLPEHLQYLPPEGKLKLGLSTIGLTVSPGRLTASGLTLKKIIRKAGRSVRLVPNQEVMLSTAQVMHNNLTGELGRELVAVATDHGTTLLAQTIAVQDIDSYSLRDRGRPKRDARVGMLPPKLAQIIINLTNTGSGKTILDPFCGTGVVLQEALLMGYHAVGTDMEPRMIEYSETNLEWLSEQFHTAHNYELAVADATNYAWEQQFNSVVGETYLGRPFTEKPSGEMIAQTASEVNLILKKFLKNLYAQLTPGTRLCLAVPAWQTAPDRFKHLPLIDQLSEMGYNPISFEHVRSEQLLYYREDQTVARELLVLTRK
jgi:tRNA G10  N-methylase Trm11